MPLAGKAHHRSNSVVNRGILDKSPSGKHAERPADQCDEHLILLLREVLTAGPLLPAVGPFADYR